MILWVNQELHHSVSTHFSRSGNCSICPPVTFFSKGIKLPRESLYPPTIKRAQLQVAELHMHWRMPLSLQILKESKSWIKHITETWKSHVSRIFLSADHQTGEGNGNPLQCSCLENPRDRETWWAAVYGVAHVGHNWSDLAAAADHQTMHPL